MSASIPPLARDVQVHGVRDVELNDSCNCCFGRRAKKVKPKDVESNEEFIRQIQYPSRVRDIDDVLRLKIEVDVPHVSPHSSHRSSKEKRGSHDHSHANDSKKQSEAPKPIRSSNSDTKT